MAIEASGEVGRQHLHRRGEERGKPSACAVCASSITGRFSGNSAVTAQRRQELTRAISSIQLAS